MAKKKSTFGSMGGAMKAAAGAMGKFTAEPEGKPAGFVPKSKSGHKASRPSKGNNRKPG